MAERMFTQTLGRDPRPVLHTIIAILAKCLNGSPAADPARAGGVAAKASPRRRHTAKQN